MHVYRFIAITHDTQALRSALRAVHWRDAARRRGIMARGTAGLFLELFRNSFGTLSECIYVCIHINVFLMYSSISLYIYIYRYI